MSIRGWSLTRFWAATAGIWLLALGLAGFHRIFRFPRILLLALAIVPAFLAGAWAGTHPEIATWSRARMVVLWIFTLGTVWVAADYCCDWSALALVVGAPAGILSLRWYELTRGHPRLGRDQDPIVTPPPSPSRAQLPPHQP